MAAVRNLIVRGGADFSGLRRAMSQVGASTKQLQSTFTVATNGMQSAVNRVGSCLDRVLAVAGVASLAALGKQAIDTAADLQEVQNVVDTAFGSMAASAEKFAKSSKNYGLSELQAKQTSATYMAMSKSLGIAADRATSMSIAATALTGDMSSFFNVSQDIADTAIKSIWTGETESLKEFGVVMTQANLQAYAMSRGINKSIQDMSQSEQTLLRYNYVMEQLQYVQGDYLKTQDSWSNQVRTTGQRLKDVMSYFGSGLINVFDGIFTPLDTAIDKMEYFARLFETVTGRLFGFASGSSGSSTIASAMGDAASSASDFSSEIESANEAAKKATLSIDQLHTLGTTSTNSNGGLSGSITDFGTDSYYMDKLGADNIIDDNMIADIDARANQIVDNINTAMTKIKDIGGKITLDRYIGDLQTAYNWAIDNKTAIVTLGTAAATAFGAYKISQFGGLPKVLAIAGKSISGLLGAISLPAVLIAAVIAAIVAGFVQMYQESDAFRAVIDNTLASIVDNLNKIMAKAQEIWQGTLSPFLDELWQMLQKLWTDLLKPMGATIIEGILAIVALALQLAPAVMDVFNTVLSGIIESWRGLMTIIDGIIDVIYGIVDGFLTGDWSRLWTGAGKIVTGIFEAIINTIKTGINTTIGIINAITGIISDIHIDVPDWVPVIGGKSFDGIDIPKIPSLATGGVAYGESIVRVGEYAGAAGNPELIAPQSIIQDIMADGNMGVIDAIYVMCARVVGAIEANQPIVNIGGKSLEREVTQQQNNRAKMTGKTVLAI